MDFVIETAEWVAGGRAGDRSPHVNGYGFGAGVVAAANWLGGSSLADQVKNAFDVIGLRKHVEHVRLLDLVSVSYQSAQVTRKG